MHPSGMDRPATRGALVTLFMILVALTPLLHVSVLRNPDLPRYPLLAAIAGLGLFACVFEAWRGRRELHWHALLSLMCGYFVWATLSVLWTQDTQNFAIEITQLTALVLIGLLAAQIGDEKNTRLLLSIATGCAAIAALLGIWQNYGFNPFGLRDSWIMGSTFYFKNHAAMYFDFILPAAFVLLLLASTRMTQWLVGLALALCAAYVLTARTRGSWLGLSIAAATLVIVACKSLPRGWLWERVKERRFPLAFAALFAVVVFLIPGQMSVYWNRSAMAGQVLDVSSENRLRFYYNALPMIVDQPLLGTGLGSFRQAFRTYMHSNIDIISNSEDMYLDRLHSDPMQYFVELGLIGGALAWSIYFMALVVGAKIVRTAREQPVGLLALALTLGLVANGVHALIDFPYHKPASATHYYLSLGLLIGLTGTLGATRVFAVRKSLLGAAMFVAVAFLAHNAIFYTAYLRDNYYALRAMKAAGNRNCADAKRYIDQAEREFGKYWATPSLRTSIYANCERDAETLLRVMTEELQYEPTNARALLTRGSLYVTHGMLEPARNDFQRVIELFPKRGSAYYGMARIAVAENRDRDALVLLDTAIGFEPMHIDALTLRTELRRKHGIPLTP